MLFLNPTILLLHLALLFDKGTMLFEKLVEQHRVHLVVAHAVRFSFLVAHHKVGIYLFYIFGYKAQLRGASWINLLLVSEGNRFERQEDFAGFVHRFNLFLKTP